MAEQVHLSKSGRRSVVVILFFGALAVRIGRAYQVPVVAPDAIRYIEQAKMLMVDPMRAVREEVYHPLFSLALAGLYRLIEPLKWGDLQSWERMSWIYAAQAIGVFCGALLAVLIFMLARQLGARFWPAVAAGILWNVGKRTSAYGGDGI